MYRYKNILVGIKFEENDNPVIKYAIKASNMAKSKNLYFLHVEPDVEIAPEIGTKFPELLIVNKSLQTKAMQEMVEKNNERSTKTKLHYKFISGKKLFTFLHFVRDNDIDIVIIGRKQRGKSAAILTERITRKAPCSVMIIPSNATPDIKRVMIASDFSENSLNALDVAIAFAKAAGLNEVIFAHLYKVPIGYYKTGKSYNQFAEIMKQNAQENFEQFINKIDLRGITVTPIIKVYKNKPVDVINNLIKHEKIDLITLGSRGRSSSAAILMGSLTEQLLKSSDIPLIAVKKKGANMQFVEALINI